MTIYSNTGPFSSYESLIQVSLIIPYSGVIIWFGTSCDFNVVHLITLTLEDPTRGTVLYKHVKARPVILTWFWGVITSAKPILCK